MLTTNYIFIIYRKNAIAKHKKVNNGTNNIQYITFCSCLRHSFLQKKEYQKSLYIYANFINYCETFNVYDLKIHTRHFLTTSLKYAAAWNQEYTMLY